MESCVRRYPTYTKYWISVIDNDPTLTQHWTNVLAESHSWWPGGAGVVFLYFAGEFGDNGGMPVSTAPCRHPIYCAGYVPPRHPQHQDDLDRETPRGAKKYPLLVPVLVN